MDMESVRPSTGGCVTPLNARPAWWVWKFGGSSVKDFERLNKVSDLILEQISSWEIPSSPIQSPYSPKRPTTGNSDTGLICSPLSEVAANHLAVVVSALGGVTNLLDDSVRRAQDVSSQKWLPHNVGAIRSSSGECPTDLLRTAFLCELKGCVEDLCQSPHDVCQASRDSFLEVARSISCIHIFGPPLLKVIKRHLGVLQQIQGSRKALDLFETSFFANLTDIVNVLQTVSITSSVTEAMKSLVLGFGEIWSVQLLKLVLENKKLDSNLSVHSLNARDVLTLSQVSRPGLADKFQKYHKRPQRPERCNSCNSISYSSAGFLPLRSGHTFNLKTVDVDEEESTSLEEYEIGQPPINGATPIDPVLCTWAFPPYETLPKAIFLGSGPPSVGEGTVPKIDWQTSYQAMAAWFYSQTSRPSSKMIPWEQLRSSEIPILDSKPTVYLLLITGFICQTLDGVPTTLQRNGSDTSAVAFAALLRAEGVTLWSDVAGIYSGDPRDCPDARQLSQLSYEEALELAGTGAKVLHPGSLLPCMQMKMPMLLKDTFNPHQPGTTIADCSDVIETAKHGKVIAKMSDVCLLSLSNSPLISVANFGSQFFRAIERVGAIPLFVTQGMSSSGVSVAVSAEQRDAVMNAIAEAFKHAEEDMGNTLRLTLDNDCSILSVVGRGQVSFVGALAEWCRQLKEAKVNIKAVAQSTSELSTSFVVAKNDEIIALKALHSCVIS